MSAAAARCAAPRSTRKPTSATSARPRCTRRAARPRTAAQARAMAKGTRYGRKAQEEAWQNVEVDALYRLAAAGVRVPPPACVFRGRRRHGTADRRRRQRRAAIERPGLSEEPALAYHGTLIAEIVRMLCAGVIHGDLSEYNVLVTADGPVIIDLPQAVDAAGNNNAASMLKRDVANITDLFQPLRAGARDHAVRQRDLVALREREIAAGGALTGHFEASTRPADVAAVMAEISDVRAEHEARQRYKAMLERAIARALRTAHPHPPNGPDDGSRPPLHARCPPYPFARARRPPLRRRRLHDHAGGRPARRHGARRKGRSRVPCAPIRTGAWTPRAIPRSSCRSRRCGRA